MVSKSKRFLSVLCALVVLISSYAGYAIPMQVNAAETSPILDLEKDVKWFGRTFADGGTHNFSWSNSGFQFTFYGTGAKATLQATQNIAGDAAQTAYIKIYVDDVLLKDVAVAEAATEVTLASGLAKGEHTIKVVKRTSGYYSTIALSKIQLDAGSKIKTTQMHSERTMLFIGDDFTSGYASKATASSTDTKYDTTEYEDSTISYTALAAEYFGAENMTVALPSRGLVNNGKPGSTSHRGTIFFEYHDYFSRSKNNLGFYDHSQYAPDVVVINLGNFDEVADTASASESGTTITATERATFKTACKSFILQVRAAYPEAKILYTYGINKVDYKATIEEVVKELNNSGYSDIYYQGLTQITTAQTGYKGHPTTAAHQSLSKELIAVVENITGWAGKSVVKNPVSSESQVDTLYTPFEQTDISVMSYNVLSHDDKTYEAYGTRMAKVAKMIKAYNPDVIGLQEVARPYDSYTHDWPGYLSSNCTEYASVRLDTQANNTGLMRIGNGLMIMYKKDRFDLVTSGYQQYKTYTDTATYGGKTYTVTDTSRWFHWVQLKDKTTGQVFYLYNTHLTVNGSTPVADRVSQCRILAQHIVKTNGASSCPFFITGDFNTTLDAGDGALDKLINYNKKDDGASAVALFNDGASVADYTRFSDRGGSLDHVFVANRYIDVKEFHVAAEGVDGRRTSDHSPHIAYCNFKGNATINGVDTAEKVFKDSSSSNTYNFTFNFGTSVKCEIYDGNTNSLLATKTDSTPFSVTLNKAINRFGIKFYDAKGNTSCIVTAIITNTSVAQPTVTATGAINSYFANGAYHVLANESTSTLSTSNGNFYSNPYASRTEAATKDITTAPAGRSVHYLKTTAGDIYPVYIYKKTAEANTDSSVFYVDDDMGSATGTVAFYDGTDVIFVEAGTKAFSTVAAVAAKTNTINGATVYFAPGNYSSSDVKFTKDVILLGNNYNTSAVERKDPNWLKAERDIESVIDGGFVFESAGNISVTVKGFTIEGTSTNGPIYVNDTTSSLSARASHVQTLDIQNNIITGGGNGSSSSYAAAIHAYSGTQIKGVVKNNYFRSTLNQDALGDKGKTRAVAAKNLNGLVIDSNYFIGYSILFDFTDEVSSSVAGNSVYTVLRNRMEHCGTARNYVKGITSNTSADISYLDNDFVRCSGEHSVYAIYFNFNQNSLGNNCSRININIIGNRFSDCYRSLQFTRSSAAAQTGNLAEATVRVNKNSFINPTEGSWKKYFRSIDLSFCVVGATANGTISPQKWNFADNHFESTFLVTEYNDLQNYYDNNIYELNYIRYYSTQSAGSDSKSFIISADHFKTATMPTAASAAEAFSGATGSMSEGYAYDFENDLKYMKLTRGGVSPFREKFAFSIGTNSSNISITSELAARMDGFAQFYSDDRWVGENKISVDLKMDSEGSNFAGFYIKYGAENVSGRAKNIVFFENDGVRGDSANSTTGTTGIGFSFRTINNTPCIEVFVKYLNSSGKIAVSGQYFYDVVDNLEEFNTYMVEDDGAGNIKFYANGNLFATLVCTDAKVPTINTSYTETYYSNVVIQDKDGATLSTVSNALVSTESALAFGSRNENFEIDNVIIIGGISEPAEKPYELKIDGAQVTLSDEINMRFVVNKDKFDEEGYSNPVVKVEFGTKTCELQATNAVIDDISYYVYVFENIAPQMMNDNINVSLFAERNNEVVQGASVETSVAKYVYAQLENTTDAKLRTLLVDMLRYGAAAQKYVKYNIDNLADAALSTEQASWGTQNLRELTSVASAPNFNGDAMWLGMSLNLDNKVKIQGYFTAPVEQGMYIQVTNSDNNVIRTIRQEDFRSEAGTIGTSAYSFVFDKLTLKQMSEKVGFTVYNAQGQNISGTIFYSIESYAQRNLNSSDMALVNLLKTMMMYGDAARAYAG